MLFDTPPEPVMPEPITVQEVRAAAKKGLKQQADLVGLKTAPHRLGHCKLNKYGYSGSCRATIRKHRIVINVLSVGDYYAVWIDGVLD